MREKERENLPPAFYNHRKPANGNDELLLNRSVPLGWLVPLREPHVELLHEVTYDHLHLLQREILADAVCGSEREWDERVRVVSELLARERRQRGWELGCICRVSSTLCDDPSFGEERCGRREVSRVPLHRVEVHTGLRPFRNIAGQTG